MKYFAEYKIQAVAHVFAAVLAIVAFFLAPSKQVKPLEDRYYLLLFVFVVAPLSSILSFWLVKLITRILDFVPKESKIINTITVFYQRFFLSAVLYLPSVGTALFCIGITIWLVFKRPY